MKTRNLIILIVILFISNTSFSQDCPRYKENREKIESEKVSFITEKLDLTVKEAQKFWPIYNEFQKKRDAIFIEKRTLHKKLTKNTETLSDKEIIEGLNKVNALKLKEVQLEKEYTDKYLKVLPAKKVIMLHKTEMEFKRTLLHKLKGSKYKK